MVEGLPSHARGYRPSPEGSGSSAGFAVEKQLALICYPTSPWQQERGWTGSGGRPEAGGRSLPLRPNSKAQSLIPPWVTH